jgi:hypothetical protein
VHLDCCGGRAGIEKKRHRRRIMINKALRME